ncbi:MAG: hypothetical protein AAGJ17_12545, partial [Pseudomonadota bacterium]
DIDELEMWAQLLDMREDIDTQQVEGVLYALSNPEQMGEVTISNCLLSTLPNTTKTSWLLTQ